MSTLGDNGNYDMIPIAVIETEPLHSLAEDDFNFVDEILECNDELNFYNWLFRFSPIISYSSPTKKLSSPKFKSESKQGK